VFRLRLMLEIAHLTKGWTVLVELSVRRAEVPGGDGGAPRSGPVVEVERRFARSAGAYVSSTHSVTISATGWMLTWRVTPSTTPLKL